jgi:hypothetical protein
MAGSESKSTFTSTNQKGRIIMNTETQPKTLELDDGPVAADNPVANGFTRDAQERVGRLRALAAEFPDETNPRPLTVAEVRLARATTVTALEKAALFTEAAPGVSTGVADAKELREVIAFELAYGGLRDEALAMARRVDHAILRRKLKAVRATRGLYQLAKSYVAVDVGDSVRTHLGEMKRSLVRPKRKPLPATEPAAPAVRK